MDALRKQYDWGYWGRPKQHEPPGDWEVWLLLMGRGWGKSRTAAEWVRYRVESGQARSIALVGPTFGDIRRYMVGGYKGKDRNGSGLIDISPPWNRPKWYQNQGELRWPNGAVAYVCTGEKPELRGPNLDTIWCDEIIKWPRADALWTNIQLTLREKGIAKPRIIMSTTPRPMELLRSIIMDDKTHTTHGTTAENDLNIETERMYRLFGGTRQGLQELEAEVLGDNPDALFHQTNIDTHRCESDPDIVRVVVSIDPAVSQHRKSDATGIVVVGLGADDHCYVLADATARMTPEQWGEKAIELFDDWDADGFVVERNRAGDLVQSNVRAAAEKGRQLQFFEVLAMGNKGDRALPVSTLYQKGLVHHVGILARLENEMCEWNPAGGGQSPNGTDALVHAVCELTGIDSEMQRPAARDWQGITRKGAGVAGQTWDPLALTGASRTI